MKSSIKQGYAWPFGGTVYACSLVALGAFMKRYTECCLNCSTVTEGHGGAVSLWFACIQQAVQLGGAGRVFLSVLGLYLTLMVYQEHSGRAFPWLLLAPGLGRYLALRRL